MTETERKLIRGAMYELGIDTLVGAGERLNDAMRYDNVQSIRGDNAVASLVLMMQQNAPEPYKPAIANLIAELNITESPAPTPEPPAPIPPSPVVNVPSGDYRAQLEAMGVVFAPDGTISGFKLKTSGAAEGDFYGYVGVVDGAFRLFSGIRERIGQAWPIVDTNTNLPVTMHAYERDGGISWDYEPPLKASDPNSRPFKTLVMYLAGFMRGIGPRGKNGVGTYLDFCTFERGRGWRFNTRRIGSTTPDIDTALQLDAEHGNPVIVRVGGQLRRLVIGADGRPDFGEVVSEFL